MKKVGTILGMAAATISLGAYLCYINGADLLGALLLFLLSGAASSLYLYLFYIHDGARKRAESEQSLIDGMYEIAYYRSKRRPIASSIIQASRNISALVSEPFLELSNRIRFGEEIPTAFDRAATKILHGKFDWLGARITESRKSIQNFLRIYESESERRAAMAGAKIQTGATISMFVSTILPAFIIFSFIGSAVISNGAISLFTLSVLMLVAIPVAYTTISVVQHDHIFKK